MQQKLIISPKISPLRLINLKGGSKISIPQSTLYNIDEERIRQNKTLYRTNDRISGITDSEKLSPRFIK